jgi:hypothetical protein
MVSPADLWFSVVRFHHLPQQFGECDDIVQSHRVFEAGLGVAPARHGPGRNVLALFCQHEFFRPPVVLAGFHREKAVALQRPQVAPERGAVEHHDFGKLVDGLRADVAERRQDRQLRYAQAARRQRLIEMPGRDARRLPQQGAGAAMNVGPLGHG